MRQLDTTFQDSTTSDTLSPQQFIERWRPLLESLDRLFADPQDPLPLSGHDLVYSDPDLRD